MAFVGNFECQNQGTSFSLFGQEGLTVYRDLVRNTPYRRSGRLIDFVVGRNGRRSPQHEAGEPRCIRQPEYGTYVEWITPIRANQMNGMPTASVSYFVMFQLADRASVLLGERDELDVKNKVRVGADGTN